MTKMGDRLKEGLTEAITMAKLMEENERLTDQNMRLKNENERLKEDLIALVGYVPTKMVFDGEKFTPEQ